MKSKMNPKAILSRRDFLRLMLTTGGAIAVSPLLKACGTPTTPPPTSAPTGAAPPASSLLDGLRGLDIDSFFQQAWRRWVIRDPESLTTLGPVILLDEVMAELDLSRRADLLKFLGETEQSLLTATDLHMFTPEFVDGAKVWRIRAGAVQIEAE